ncbi:MAG: molecular chaperone DnaK [Clostridia bacterium]
MNTKPITTIELSNNDFDNIAKELCISEINTQIQLLISNVDDIVESFKNILYRQKKWMQISNKDLFYNHDICALFPNLKTFELGSTSTLKPYNADDFNNEFEGYTGTLMSIDEFIFVFSDKADYLKSNFDFDLPEYFTIDELECCVNRNGSFGMMWNGDKDCLSHHLPVHKLDNTKLSSDSIVTVSAEKAIMYFIKEDLIPVGLSSKNEAVLQVFIKLYNKNPEVIKLTDDEKLVCNEEILRELVSAGYVDSIDGTKSLDVEAMKNLSKESGPIEIQDSDILNKFVNTLLTCDTVRADIDSYDAKILTDPNRGHWDLWEENSTKGSEITAEIKVPLLAKDPASDINFDGVIGIDFGTKSTVVVFQENTEHTMPMRIGTGKLSKEIEPYHYENPTILEFVDFEKFMKDYSTKEGRPATSWQDITTSHTAFDGFLNSNSEQYYAYLYELKQWAGDKNRKIRLRDKKSRDIMLSPYITTSEDEEDRFDPIELYAYYIGLYINNMHNGIYLDYLLSYPVAYEKSIRDKMIESFTRGIKKSLPVSILNDEEIMNKFRVTIGASEPVAYAICALEEYGFEPEDDDKVYYGVFDFGGGTTDFDFGCYYESTERRYDYVCENFGDGGDQYLGGENLLELLAYEVFKSNQSTLRQQSITFTLPPECKRFLGSETLLSESQEAKLNTAQLMEKLRHFWEKTDGYEQLFESGILKVNLFDIDGEQKLNFELVVDLNDIEKFLRDRIEKGVRNFFYGMVDAFDLPKTASKIKNINIFLAGNSSKSDILKSVFNEYIQKYNGIISQTDKEMHDNNYFTIFPPLGTSESDDFQIENGAGQVNQAIERPTGKTGVAFGLVKSRLGGKIKLVTSKQINEEIKFMFYIGYEKKQKFKIISDRDIEYRKWYNFIDASEVDFTIFYSKLPEAKEGVLDIKLVSRKKCRLEKANAKANVYYRAVLPDTIEFVVAYEDEIEKEVYLSEISSLQLVD